MKPINEYTLQECIERLSELPDGTVDDACDKVMLPHLPWIFDVAVALADRIEELTRWIPVAERMPTEADADRHGCVLIREVENESPNRVYRAEVRWSDVQKPNYFYTVTDWKRIDP
jgi:hypothetical protein